MGIETKCDHYKAMYEAVEMTGWSAMEQPKQHVEKQNGACDSNLTPVFEKNKDEDTKVWIESLKTLNKKICEYVEKHFKSSGLPSYYNANGESLIDAKEIVIEKKDFVKKSIFRFLHYLFIKCTNLDLLDRILSEFTFTNETKAKYVGFSYPTPTKEEIERGTPRYDQINIIESLLKDGKLEKLKKLTTLFGDDHPDFIQSSSKLNERGTNALENAIWKNQTAMYKYLLSVPGIQSLYDSSNKDDKTGMAIFRLLYTLFNSDSDDVIDEVLNALNFNGEIISKYLSFHYPEPQKENDSYTEKFHKYNIVQSIISNRNIDRFKKLQSILGERQFVEAILETDDKNMNALEYSIKNGKTSHYEHLLTIQGIVDYYSSNAEDDVDYDTAIYRLLYTLFVNCSDDKMVDKVLQSLNISNEIISKYINYQHPKEEQKKDDKEENQVLDVSDYNNYT